MRSTRRREQPELLACSGGVDPRYTGSFDPSKHLILNGRLSSERRKAQNFGRLRLPVGRRVKQNKEVGRSGPISAPFPTWSWSVEPKRHI